MRPLILVGGGGHCKSVIDACESVGFSIKGILDTSENIGKNVLSYLIIGTDDDISDYVSECNFVITVGFIKDASLRLKLQHKVQQAGGRFGTIIASTAYVSKYAQIGMGTVVLHHAMINAGATIGESCIINTFANIEHDAIVGDNCHISTGTMVNGDCHIGDEVFLGSQSVLVNGINITSGCIVAAGSLVHKNIQQRGIYSGNPATLKIKL